MVQATAGQALDNSLLRAEEQLAIPSSIPAFIDTNTTVQTINQNKQLAGSAGNFADDYPVPGLYDSALNPLGNGDADFAVEIVAYLELSAGIHTFGAITDDGYKASSGSQLHDSSSGAVIAFHNGGPANETFDFVVTTAGIYPFRFMWYERGGSAHAELFSVDRASGTRTLINDPAAVDSIKAYLDVTQIQLLSAPVVTGPYLADPNAVLDVSQNKFTTPASGNSRFYRLLSNTAQRISSIRVTGGNVEIRYTAAP